MALSRSGSGVYGMLGVILAALVGLGLWMPTPSDASGEAYSVNVVGYLALELPRGYSLVRFDFLEMEGTATPSRVFGNQLPPGSELLCWNGTNYVTDRFAIQTGPPPFFPVLGTNWLSDTLDLSLGTGFWVTIPTNAAQAAYTVYVAGEVPGALTVPSNLVEIAEGYNLVGYSYPVDTAWTSTTLAAQAAVGDEMLMWNSEQKAFIANRFREEMGPPPSFPILGTNWVYPGAVVPMGNAFWYRRVAGAGDVDWIETKPYDNP